jgi:hypothetical protein
MLFGHGLMVSTQPRQPGGNALQSPR